MEDAILILSIISLILSFHEEFGLSEIWNKSQKAETPNKFANAVENLELMDKTKYNCVIQHEGRWVYGWMENKGISIAEGMNTKASGEYAVSEGMYNSASSK